jgi:cytochrome P450
MGSRRSSTASAEAPQAVAAFPGPKGRAHARVLNLAGGDVRAALDACRVDHGDAFVFGFGAIRFHWFLAPDAFRFVLQDAADAFGNAGAYGFLEPIGGPLALIATDDPDHLRRRRVVQPAFHQREAAAWAAHADAAFAAFVAGARAGGTAPLVPALRPVVLDVVLDVLVGAGARRRRPTLAGDLAAMMAFANLPMLAQQVRLAVPATPWARFLAARRRADAAVLAEVRDRRAGRIDDDAGVLGWLLAGDEDPGTRWSEPELRDQVVGLLSAAFDTTTSAIAWTVFLLARPELRAPVAEELREAGRPGPRTEALVAEALRLYPPASAILRRVRRPVAWQGAPLPAGARVGLSVWHLHRDERLWPDPTRAEPRRWTERDGPWAAPRDPFAYLPFGHGGRRCIGEGLARTLLRSFVAAALPRARWDAVDGDAVHPVGTTLLPSDGLRLRWGPV